MARGISLRREETALVEAAPRTALRLRVSATDATGMTAAVFLHQRGLGDPYSDATDPADELVAVCNPFDLATYPVDEPADDQSPPFFRKDSLDILVPPGEVNGRECSAEEALERAWTAIHEAVCALVADLDRLDVLNERATVRCGDEPESSASESASMSTGG